MTKGPLKSSRRNKELVTWTSNGLLHLFFPSDYMDRMESIGTIFWDYLMHSYVPVGWREIKVFFISKLGHINFKANQHILFLFKTFRKICVRYKDMFPWFPGPFIHINTRTSRILELSLHYIWHRLEQNRLCQIKRQN